jgi:hypothetical protein
MPSTDASPARFISLPAGWVDDAGLKSTDAKEGRLSGLMGYYAN